MLEAELFATIFYFTSPNNEERNAAEKQYNLVKESDPRQLILYFVSWIVNREIVSRLSSHALQNRDVVCSLCAILLRSLTFEKDTPWLKLSEQEFAMCRVHLLEAVTAEVPSQLKRKIANLIVAVSDLAPWSELLESIVSLSKQTDEETKRLSMYLLEKLAENKNFVLTIDILSVLCPIILNMLYSSDVITASAAAQTLCSILIELPLDSYANPLVAQLIKSIERVSVITKYVGENSAYDVDAQNLLGALFRLCCSKPQSFEICHVHFFQVLLDLLNCTSAEISSQIKCLCINCGTELLTSMLRTHDDICEAFLNAIMTNCTKIEDNVESHAEFFNENFIDVDGFADLQDLESDNICYIAGRSLESLSKILEPAEILRVCLHAAWKFIEMPDWKARRAALFITSAVCEGVKKEIYPLLPTLVPAVVRLMNDDHPRVRFIAAYCLSEIISQFGREHLIEDDDQWEDDEDDEGEEECSFSQMQELESFQKLFGYVPRALCACLAANTSYHRVSHMALIALRQFFDPSHCDPSWCDLEIISSLIQSCTQMFAEFIQKSAIRPYYLLQEGVSLLANLSNLCPKEITERYPYIMDVLKIIIGEIKDSPNETVINQHDYALISLQCRCLECFALLGKAVGLEVFRGDAIALLSASLIPRISAGLDFGDEISSYICQTSVRIASVLGSEFEPYVQFLLPVILRHVKEDIPISVVESDCASLNDIIDEDDDFDESSHVYMRGRGMMTIRYNSSRIREKTMACRMLYQLSLDLPQFLPFYVPDAVQSLLLVVESVAFDDEIALIVGNALRDFLFIFAKYQPTPIPEDACKNLIAMSEAILNSFLSKLEQNQASVSSESGNIIPQELIHNIIDGIRETLMLLYDLRYTFTQIWPVELHISELLSNNLSCAMQKQLALFVSSRYIQQASSKRDEYVELEDSINNSILDSLGYIMKISSGSITNKPYQQYYMTEVLPFMFGLLQIKSADPKLLLLPINNIIDAIQYMDFMRDDCIRKLYSILLQDFENSDLIQPCVYSLGICCMNDYGNAISADQLSSSIVILLRVLGIDQGSPLLQLDLNDEEISRLQDNALSALFRLSVSKQHILGPEVSEQMMRIALEQFPLKVDLQEAKDVHKIFLELFQAQDMRLLLSEYRLFTEAFSVAAKLKLIVCTEKKKHGIIEDENEFWGKQIVTKDVAIRIDELIIALLNGAKIDPNLAIKIKIESFTPRQAARLRESL